jgi:bacteriocin-like protein
MTNNERRKYSMSDEVNSDKANSTDRDRNDNHPIDGELSDEELSNVTGGISGFASPFSYGTKPGDSTEDNTMLGLHDMVRAKRDSNNDVLKGFKD